MTQLILFNKPYGIVSQFSGDRQEETLASYIKMKNFYAVGRLDKQSEGLILLTDNGALQHRLSHPKFHKKKYYWVQVEGIPSEAALQLLQNSLKLKDYTCLPAKAVCIEEPVLWPRTPPVRYRKSIPTSWLEIVLEEGKNHQIRKMTATVGLPTLRLVRYKIGQWDLGYLQPGEFKIIDKEV